MAPLSLSDFAAGTLFTVSAGDQAYPFALSKAQALSDSGREGGSFRLEFIGPGEPVLPQAIYPFSAGREAPVHEIFIVPIARGADGVRYEAVFY